MPREYSKCPGPPTDVQHSSMENQQCQENLTSFGVGSVLTKSSTSLESAAEINSSTPRLRPIAKLSGRHGSNLRSRVSNMAPRRRYRNGGLPTLVGEEHLSRGQGAAASQILSLVPSMNTQRTSASLCRSPQCRVESSRPGRRVRPSLPERQSARRV